jgi:hypothetical protein
MGCRLFKNPGDKSLKKKDVPRKALPVCDWAAYSDKKPIHKGEARQYVADLLNVGRVTFYRALSV